jgi:urease accessory protein
MRAMTTDRSLYRLMTWLSPAYPVGGYSYSHGIETAVEEGLLATVDDFRTWLDGLLAFGGLRLDAALLKLTLDAVSANDVSAFLDIAERAATLRGTAELALESLAQGEAFLGTVRATQPSPALDHWAAVLAEARHAPAYPVAVGLAAAVAMIPARPAVIAFLHAGIASLVSAGVRHIPLGQTQGQRLMVTLEDAVQTATDAALTTPLEDLGTAAVMVDWCSARHETQPVRLFRS